jgi:hypothetical protein
MKRGPERASRQRRVSTSVVVRLSADMFASVDTLAPHFSTEGAGCDALGHHAGRACRGCGTRRAPARRGPAHKARPPPGRDYPAPAPACPRPGVALAADGRRPLDPRELIRIADGEPILGHDGEPTWPVDWAAIVEAAPEVMLIAPCGFRVEQSLRELPDLTALPRFAELPAVRGRRVVIADGNAFFNRPGPRLVESAEIAAVAIHPEPFAGRFGVGPNALVEAPT